MRTRFLLSMLLISAGLTTTSLLLVQRSVQSHVREGLRVDLRNSVSIFENFQHEREKMLTRSAQLLADLPITRALMTSHDPATIQDASADVWQLAGSDLFVLVDRNGSVVGLHTKSSGFTREMAQKYFHQSLDEEIRVTGGSEPTISTRPSYNPFTSVLRPKARFWAFSSLVMKSMTVLPKR